MGKKTDGYNYNQNERDGISGKRIDERRLENVTLALKQHMQTETELSISQLCMNGSCEELLKLVKYAKDERMSSIRI